MTLINLVSFCFYKNDKQLRMKLLTIISLLLSITLFSSCAKKNVQETIQEYLDNNNLQAESTAEGLFYIIEEPGNDEHPTVSSNVTIDYKGTLTNGNQFDSSYDRGEPLVISLRNVISGWQIGIPLFGKGGKGKLIIPPSLGYGSNGQGSIPGNSVLIFDIELHDFE